MKEIIIAYDENTKASPVMGDWVGELVRCKDCIYWDEECTEECDNSDSVCFHNGWCKPDWFCADGEHKDRR